MLKAQTGKNRGDALIRLRELVEKVLSTPKKRKPTRPTRNAKEKRLQRKINRGKIKTLRKKIGRSARDWD